MQRVTLRTRWAPLRRQAARKARPLRADGEDADIALTRLESQHRRQHPGIPDANVGWVDTREAERYAERGAGQEGDTRRHYERSNALRSR